MVTWAEILLDYLRVEAIKNPDYENIKFAVLLDGSLLFVKVDPDSIALNMAYELDDKECEKIFKQNYYGDGDSNYLEAILRHIETDLAHKCR